MISQLIKVALHRSSRLSTAVTMAAWMSSPMSWSPDGEWVSYTVAIEAERDQLKPGWLFTTTVEEVEGHPETPVRSAGNGSPAFRIWATDRERRTSVLIEESPAPLTAPAWSPLGKSIAFGRLVPESIHSGNGVQRGQFEVVVQDGLNSKRVIWSSGEFELGPTERAAIPHVSCAWSPDGVYVAVPRPVANFALDIVRTSERKRAVSLEHARLAAWSPDGSKCAFVRDDNGTSRLEYIERHGQSFGEPRPLAVLGPITTAPHWFSDGRSILSVAEKSAIRTHDLEIVRLILDPSESVRMMSLVPEAARRGANIRGLVIDFDRDAERCFYSLDLGGRDTSAVVWCLPRDRGSVHKRFHPLDVSQRVVGMSISPDGQLVAMRLASTRGLTPPVVYDTETDQTSLVVPDSDARRAWLTELAGTARSILLTSLPPAVVDGKKAQRPTLLPIPGELPLHDDAILRLNRLARFGSALVTAATDRPEPLKRQGVHAAEAETALFFHYLAGEYESAVADLGHAEPLLTEPGERLALLSVRAQLLWARGERSQARAVIDYLTTSGDGNRRLVEETPLGLSFLPAPTAQHLWATYLATAANQKLDATAKTGAELPTDVFDPGLRNPAGEAAGVLIEGGVGPVPFAPVGPRREFP